MSTISSCGLPVSKGYRTIILSKLRYGVTHPFVMGCHRLHSEKGIDVGDNGHGLGHSLDSNRL
jgi:hypothetical protein